MSQDRYAALEQLLGGRPRRFAFSDRESRFAQIRRFVDQMSYKPGWEFGVTMIPWKDDEAAFRWQGRVSDSRGPDVPGVISAITRSAAFQD